MIINNWKIDIHVSRLPDRHDISNKSARRRS
ncbi:uncharacterized protein METZ01_LOCUS41787 [marine metagenome]|uniref:Uncharacterized protein n=1 Tax=marine metagenome TaxID=408172 RepID=A0A381RIJ3_9ZZZZ